jgi:hypothetical protein
MGVKYVRWKLFDWTGEMENCPLLAALAGTAGNNVTADTDPSRRAASVMTDRVP